MHDRAGTGRLADALRNAHLAHLGSQVVLSFASVATGLLRPIGVQEVIVSTMARLAPRLVVLLACGLHINVVAHEVWRWRHG